MYKGKEKLALSLAVVIMATPALVSAKDLELKDTTDKTEIILMEDKAQYTEFKGEIKKLNLEGEKGSILVAGETEELIFHIDENVFITDMTKTRENKRIHLKEGAKIKAFYPVNTPMAMSLPGQLTPEVIIIENVDGLNSKVDIFDENLVSSDNSLKLNLENAEAYTNKKLLVIYGISTKSIPAQTTPEEVYILDKEAEEEIEVKLDVEESKKEEKQEIKSLDKLVLNGEEFKVNMYKDEKGIVMIPVREVGEKLGYEVKWNGKSNPIEIKKGPQWTQITLGKNSYTFAKMAPFKLEKGPELKNGKTYVPASFLEKVFTVEEYKVVDGILNIKY